MKKFVKVLSLVLVIALMATMAAACSSKKEDTSEADTSAAEQSTQPKELVFGTNAEFPPFEFVAAEGVIGEYDGIDISIAKQLAEDNGMTARIENMEFDSLLVAVQNGQIDAAIAGMTIKPERLESVDFSIPYYKATQVMIVKEDSTIAKATDMKDKKIAVIQGYTGESCVKDMGYEYEAFKKGSDAILELMNGRCDVVVLDSATSKNYVANNQGLKIVEDADAFEGEEYAIAVKKGNKELLDKINATLEKMIADGTIEALGAKYADQ